MNRLQLKLSLLELNVNRLRVACDAKGDNWKTTETGSHILLDGEGNIKAGMGGKFNGKKISEIDANPEKQLAYNIAQKAVEKHGKGTIKEYLRGGAKEQAKQYLETQKLLGDTPSTKPKQSFSSDGLGKTSKVKTAKGTEIETRFKVVDVADLIASHDRYGNANPNFPQELQPRDRSKLTSQAWVQKTAKNLDVDSLGKTRRADSGAPIVGDDGVVESGNGRSMAIMEAYNSGHANEYREWLENEAAEFGIDPDTIKGMKSPVLVRQRITDVDRGVFTKEANGMIN